MTIGEGKRNNQKRLESAAVATVGTRHSTQDDAATRDELHEAVMTLEEAERTARRVLGGAHPITKGIGIELKNARARLRVRFRLKLSFGASCPSSGAFLFAFAAAVFAWSLREAQAAFHSSEAPPGTG